MSNALSARSPRPLSGLLAGLAEVVDDVAVHGLALDSRQVREGDLFVALGGTRAHGGAYVDDAVAAGAVAVASDAPLEARWPVPVIVIPGLDQQVGEIAARFYDHPSAELRVVGVTGTNGKTSCTHLLAQALSEPGTPCGLIGTLGNGLYGALAPSTHTTPDAISLQRMLAVMKARGAGYAVMEVSSHGLDQGRVNGVAFEAALLTNLSRDHLDYHGDMAAYARAKRRLFERPGLAWAVLNLDDELGRELVHSLPAGVRALGYSLEGRNESGVDCLVAGELRTDVAGLSFEVSGPWGKGRVDSPLLGRFNGANLLGVLGVLLALDIPFDEALDRLAGLRAPAGRMERFGGAGQPAVVVDYAHTPDALEQVLATLAEHCRGALWCVFGCGGDRDRGKRPAMAAAAERLADHLVITDDNPRHEDPEAIVHDILAGLRQPHKARVQRDRAAAIAEAVHGAAGDDVVLVAGKGHEDYQLVGDERRYFSDRETVETLLEAA